MSLRREHRRIEDNFKQAAGLLRHDLVWSEDFESIRLDLADFIQAQAPNGAANSQALLKVVDGLLATENDISV